MWPAPPGNEKEARRRAEQRGWTGARNTNQGGLKARVFVFRVVGKPRVAQPPQRDKKKRGGREQGSLERSEGERRAAGRPGDQPESQRKRPGRERAAA